MFRISQTIWLVILAQLLSLGVFSQNLQDNCIDFNALESGTKFGNDAGQEPGEIILDRADVLFSLKPFLYENGTTDYWNVTVYDDQMEISGETGEDKFLFISNINLHMDFSAYENGIQKLCLDIWDGGGIENLSLNGADVSVWEFSEQPPQGEIAPGVFAQFTPDDNGENFPVSGQLCLTGAIESMTIGGQEFIIDDLCFEVAQPFCPIEDFVVEPLPCTPNGIFYVEYGFNRTENNGSNGYQILVNDQVFGPFTYFEDFPKLGPFNPGENLFFVFQDVSFPDCQKEFKLEAVKCTEDPVDNCFLKEIKAEIIECDPRGVFSLYLDLATLENAQEKGFKVEINGEVIGNWSTTDLPLTITSQVDNNDGVINLTVCEDTENNDCCLATVLNLNNCSTTVSKCLDFESLGGQLFGGNQGNRPGDIIYEDEAGILMRILEFKNYDWTNPFGQLATYDASDEFPAAIDTYLEFDGIAAAIDFSGLEGPVEQIQFDFQYMPGVINIAVNGGEIQLLNGLEPGLYALAPDIKMEVNWTNEAFNAGTAVIYGPVKSILLGGTLLAIDNFCLNKVEEDDCSIRDMTVKATDCDENGQFYITLDAIAENVSEAFQLWLNGNDTGERYPYSALPIKLGPYTAPINQNLIFKIIDPNLPCIAEATLEPINCSQECEIGPLSIRPLDCQNDGTFFVKLDFDYARTTDGFSLYIGDDLYEKFSYADLPLEIGPFDRAPASLMQFTVVDGSESCRQTKRIETPDCSPNSCQFRDVVAEPTACDADGYFYAELRFFASNPGNPGYYVFADGEIFGPYAYESNLNKVKLGPFLGDGETIYDILVLDINQPDCYGYVEIGPKQCQSDCAIYDMEASIGDCNENGSYTLKLNFEVQDATNESFDLYRRNGEFLGYYKLSDLPIQIEDYKPSGLEYDYLKVCINDNPDCCKEIEFKGPKCEEEEDCFFTITAVENYCNDNGELLTDLEIKFDEQSSSPRKLVIYSAEGEFITTYEEGQTYITLSSLTENPDDILTFVVKSENSGVCDQKFEAGPWSCGETSACSIRDLIVKAGDCSEDATNYAIKIDFKVSNPGNEYFEVFNLENELVGYYKIADLPIAINDWPNNRNAQDGLVVCINDVDDCCAKFAWEVPICEEETDQCKIQIDVMEPYPCDENGQYLVDIEVSNEYPAADSFLVFAPDERLLGTFPYSATYITLGPFEGDGHSELELTFVDQRDESCKTEKVYGPIDCLNEAVWPGDANADNIAHHFDLLNIGIAFGQQGPLRANTSIEWAPVEGPFWNQSFIDGLNYRHADCNGDGVIDALDKEAILENYDLTHGAVAFFEPLPNTDFDPPIFVDFESLNDLNTGTTFEVPIILGEEDFPVEDIYGIAFTINFNGTNIKADQVEIVYPTTWFGDPTVNVLTLDQSKSADNLMEIAMTRTDQNNVSGYGPIAYIIGIIDDIAGIEDMTVEVEYINAITNQGLNLPINGLAKEIGLQKRPTGQRHDLLRQLTLYPNPSVDRVKIVNSVEMDIKRVTLMQPNGMVLKPLNVKGNVVRLGDIPEGLYLLKIDIGTYTVYKRIVKTQ